jgi:hypothetical protein
VSDGTASIDSPQAPSPSAGAAGRGVGPPAPIVRLPLARRRLARHRRLVAIGEWVALAGLGVGATLLVLIALIGLMGH